MKIVLYTKNPLFGLFRGTAGRSFFWHFSHRSAAQEAPAAAFIVTNGQSSHNLRIISEYYDFHRKCLFHVSRARDSLFTPLWKEGRIKRNFSITWYPHGWFSPREDRQYWKGGIWRQATTVWGE